MSLKNSLCLASGPPLEVVFSFDTTGSMYSWLGNLRIRLQDMIERLQADIPGIRIAVMAHGDYCDRDTSYVTKWIDFTNDVVKLCNFVNNVEQTQGGDAPECYELVLRQVRSMLSWTPGSRRVLILIGDDSPHEPDEECNEDKINWREETKELARMGVTIYGVQCEGANADAFYKTISVATGGKHIRLDELGSLFHTLVAVCYRESNDTAMLSNYEKEVRDGCGNKGVALDIDSIFASLKDDTSSIFDKTLIPRLRVDARAKYRQFRRETSEARLNSKAKLPRQDLDLPVTKPLPLPMPQITDQLLPVLQNTNPVLPMHSILNQLVPMPQITNQLFHMPQNTNPVVPLPSIRNKLLPMPQNTNPVPPMPSILNQLFPMHPITNPLLPMAHIKPLASPMRRIKTTKTQSKNKRRAKSIFPKAVLKKFKLQNLPLLKRENVPEVNFKFRFLEWSEWILCLAGSKDFSKGKRSMWQTRGDKPGQRLKLSPITSPTTLPWTFVEVSVQANGLRSKKHVVCSQKLNRCSKHGNWEDDLLHGVSGQVDMVLQSGCNIYIRYSFHSQREKISVVKEIRRYDYAWQCPWIKRYGARNVKKSGVIISQEL